MALALVAIYAAAGFLWAPRLIRSQAEEFVGENYGRKVEIGEIRFNPFTFELNSGAVEASRVFLITEEANATDGKVRLELSLK